MLPFNPHPVHLLGHLVGRLSDTFITQVDVSLRWLSLEESANILKPSSSAAVVPSCSLYSLLSGGVQSLLVAVPF